MRDARAPAPWLFEGFRLDLARGCLLGPGGAEVPLRPKSFDALRHLVENPGRLVPRDELMQAVWPDVFVTDDSIIQYVAEVRRALGDAGQRLLRTVPKHGYILATEVTSAPSAPVTLAVPPAEAVPKLARPDAAEADLTPRRLQARRRLAAVLAADLAGYSRLLAEDEAATLAALRGMRAELLEPLIRAHGGRVFAVMGDGLLAEFPSSVLALRCALALQASVAERWAGRPEPERLAFRVGVHQGEVVEEGDGVMGDGVNIAVRLQTLAEPGGICISGRVQEDVAGKLKLALDAEDIGERALKNIPRPVRVFRVPGAGSPRTQTGDGEVPPCPPRRCPTARLRSDCTGRDTNRLGASPVRRSGSSSATCSGAQ